MVVLSLGIFRCLQMVLNQSGPLLIRSNETLMSQTPLGKDAVNTPSLRTLITKSHYLIIAVMQLVHTITVHVYSRLI